MPFQLYCGICGELIPEEPEGEGWDQSHLTMKIMAGDVVIAKTFDFDDLCPECYERIKEAIEREIEAIEKTIKPEA